MERSSSDAKLVANNNEQYSRERSLGAAAPRWLAASLLAVLLCGSGAGADAASRPSQSSTVVADANFGSPPSGEIPILFNDHTVYAKPDVLKRGRVLAALVKGGRVYVPLRSMFEQMGATVSASADGRTVTAVKSGASVSVTLGKNEVVINGESRPLDVPPMLYKGILLVPVRVLSEALGAYVQWVPSQRVVVVRYIPPSPPPVAPPTPAPTVEPTIAPTMAPPAPAPAPTAVPTQESYRGFIQAAVAAPKNYNEFSAGQYCPRSYMVSAAYAFKDSPVAVKVDYREDAYVTSDNLTDTLSNHYTRFATIDGGVALTPVFLARQSTLDSRLEYRVAAPRVYVGLGYLHTANNYGYPNLNAVGVGIEKLPDLRSGINVFASVFYYPTASGNYTVTDPTSSNVGKTYRQQYQIVKYDVGLSLVFAHSPVYLYGGFSGNRYAAKQNAPIGQTHDGPYIGIGVKL
ncbi:copper amine oxidase N-terminal domain-containing protein [bacterium]|nr:MAG: copper amine oxidase N-terminal domain-containing protein [bacterium]